MSAERFPLARMSGLILWLTVLVLPLPLVMLWIGAQSPIGIFSWLPALFVAVIYLFVWLYMRPTEFVVSPASVEIVWPLRRLSVPTSQIERVERLSAKDFRARFGYGMRIGAGGLWGGFGLLKTRSVTFRFYISRMDDYVLLWRRGHRPLLVTPAHPERFATLLAASIVDA